MRVLLLADADFAARERAMLERLAIGIADDGAFVAMALPASFVEADAASLIQHVEYHPPPPLLGAKAQAEALSETLVDGRIASDTAPIEVIHAFGRDCRRLAIELGRLHQAAVVLEAASLMSTSELARWERRANGAGPVPMMWTAPSAALRDRLTSSARAPVAHVRWGVHIARETSDAARPDSLGVVVIANPTMGADVTAVAHALAATSKDIEREFLIVFDDAVFRRDHRLWRRMKKAALLDRVSIVPGLEARRAPALGADVLIAVTAPGEHRSTVLDAMGHGRAVITRSDPLCDWIRGDETCVAVEDFAAPTWKSALSQLLTDDARRAQLGRTALEWTRSHGSASGQVADALGAYERAIAPIRAIAAT